MEIKIIGITSINKRGELMAYKTYKYNKSDAPSFTQALMVTCRRLTQAPKATSHQWQAASLHQDVMQRCTSSSIVQFNFHPSPSPLTFPSSSPSSPPSPSSSPSCGMLDSGAATYSYTSHQSTDQGPPHQSTGSAGVASLGAAWGQRGQQERETDRAKHAGS